MLKVGDKLPNVTLSGIMNGESTDYNLGEPSGRTRVLVFFPFAFTPV